MLMLLDLAFISKASKPVTDQGLDDIQIQLSQERSTPSINDTTGNSNSISSLS